MRLRRHPSLLAAAKGAGKRGVPDKEKAAGGDPPPPVDPVQRGPKPEF